MSSRRRRSCLKQANGQAIEDPPDADKNVALQEIDAVLPIVTRIIKRRVSFSAKNEIKEFRKDISSDIDTSNDAPMDMTMLSNPAKENEHHIMCDMSMDVSMVATSTSRILNSGQKDQDMSMTMMNVPLNRTFVIASDLDGSYENSEMPKLCHKVSLSREDEENYHGRVSTSSSPISPTLRDQSEPAIKLHCEKENYSVDMSLTASNFVEHSIQNIIGPANMSVVFCQGSSTSAVKLLNDASMSEGPLTPITRSKIRKSQLLNEFSSQESMSSKTKPNLSQDMSLTMHQSNYSRAEPNNDSNPDMSMTIKNIEFGGFSKTATCAIPDMSMTINTGAPWPPDNLNSMSMTANSSKQFSPGNIQQNTCQPSISGFETSACPNMSLTTLHAAEISSFVNSKFVSEADSVKPNSKSEFKDLPVRQGPLAKTTRNKTRSSLLQYEFSAQPSTSSKTNPNFCQDMSLTMHQSPPTYSRTKSTTDSNPDMSITINNTETGGVSKTTPCAMPDMSMTINAAPFWPSGNSNFEPKSNSNNMSMTIESSEHSFSDNLNIQQNTCPPTISDFETPACSNISMTTLHAGEITPVSHSNFGPRAASVNRNSKPDIMDNSTCEDLLTPLTRSKVRKSLLQNKFSQSSTSSKTKPNLSQDMSLTMHQSVYSRAEPDTDRNPDMSMTINNFEFDGFPKSTSCTIPDKLMSTNAAAPGPSDTLNNMSMTISSRDKMSPSNIQQNTSPPAISDFETSAYPNMSLTTLHVTEISPFVNSKFGSGGAASVRPNGKPELEDNYEQQGTPPLDLTKKKYVSGKPVREIFEPEVADTTAAKESLRKVRLEMSRKKNIQVPPNSAFGRFGSAKTPKRQLPQDVFIRGSKHRALDSKAAELVAVGNVTGRENLRGREINKPPLFSLSGPPEVNTRIPQAPTENLQMRSDKAQKRENWSREGIQQPPLCPLSGPLEVTIMAPHGSPTNFQAEVDVNAPKGENLHEGKSHKPPLCSFSGPSKVTTMSRTNFQAEAVVSTQKGENLPQGESHKTPLCPLPGPSEVTTMTPHTSHANIQAEVNFNTPKPKGEKLPEEESHKPPLCSLSGPTEVTTMASVSHASPINFQAEVDVNTPKLEGEMLPEGESYKTPLCSLPGPLEVTTMAPHASPIKFQAKVDVDTPKLIGENLPEGESHKPTLCSLSVPSEVTTMAAEASDTNSQTDANDNTPKGEKLPEGEIPKPHLCSLSGPSEFTAMAGQASPSNLVMDLDDNTPKIQSPGKEIYQQPTCPLSGSLVVPSRTPQASPTNRLVEVGDNIRRGEKLPREETHLPTVCSLSGPSKIYNVAPQAPPTNLQVEGGDYFMDNFTVSPGQAIEDTMDFTFGGTGIETMTAEFVRDLSVSESPLDSPSRQNVSSVPLSTPLECLSIQNDCVLSLEQGSSGQFSKEVITTRNYGRKQLAENSISRLGISRLEPNIVTGTGCSQTVSLPPVPLSSNLIQVSLPLDLVKQIKDVKTLAGRQKLDAMDILSASLKNAGEDVYKVVISEVTGYVHPSFITYHQRFREFRVVNSNKYLNVGGPLNPSTLYVKQILARFNENITNGSYLK